MQINTVPDYLPLSKIDFLFHLFNINKYYTPKIYRRDYTYTQIYGYSCRALFETIMICFDNPDIKIATTPFHHTSFRDIIEKYVKPENITIIQLNKTYNGISKFPEIDNCDLLILTHMFGQDLMINKEGIEIFKNKHNCLIIEDRVQGGTLYKTFSNDYIDVALYSCGMDKRPVALGGGFVNIRNSHDILIEKVRKKTLEYRQERKRDRLLFLLKKIPTFILYNNRFIIGLCIKLVGFMSYFFKSATLMRITEYYRKQNPGFAHNDYLMKPSNGLLRSIQNQLPKFRDSERLYENKCNQYMNILGNDVIKQYYPWQHHNIELLTAYNAIYVPYGRLNKFLEYIKEARFCVLVNPTYKIFSFEYENRDKNKKFVDNLLYLPSIANMNQDEMEYLSNVLSNYTH